MKNTYHKGILLAFIASVASAGFMIPWKLAAFEGSAEDMVFILCVGAALVSTATLIGQGGFPAAFSRPSRLEFCLSILFALFTILGNQASARAIHYLAPAVVTSIMRLEVVFITLLAWYFLTERVNFAFWVGLGFVAIGFYTMQPSFEWQGDWWQGAFFGAAAALIFAIMAVVTRAYIHAINPSRVNGLRLWLAVILWFPIQQKLPAFDQWTGNFVWLVLCAAILGPGLGLLAIKQNL
ncbi:MAG: EamA family transporter [Oligoflexus sp.]